MAAAQLQLGLQPCTGSVRSAWQPRPFVPAAARPARCRRQQQRVACECVRAAAQQQLASSRRQALAGGAAAAAAAWLGQPGAAHAGLERYVRKKQLDPLDTYVPLVLEAREQLASLDSVMLQDPSVARQLLRSGPFRGMRDNVRALGQYAAAGGDGGAAAASEADAGALVNGFFRALEDYDLLLYNAVREAKAAAQQAATRDGDGEGEGLALDPAAGLDAAAARQKLALALERLDALVATVPAGVLDKSRAVLAKVQGRASPPAAAAAAAE